MSIPTQPQIVRPAALAPSLLRRVRGAFGPSAREGMLALADQAVVSGTSFLTTVLVGRLCGPEQLGAYSLGVTVVFMLIAAQQALITAPFTVFSHRLSGIRRRLYAGSVLMQQLMLGAVAMAGVALWSVVLWYGSGSTLGPAFLALSIAAPFLLLREFIRRYGFASLDTRKVLALDVSVACMQVGTLAWLAAAGRLNVISAFAAVAFSCAVGAGVCLYASRREFAVRTGQLRRAMRDNWAFGKWLLASELMGNLNSDVFLTWLLALVLGKTATGMFASCMTIVLFSNPFILGISNVLAPRIAAAYREGGRREVRRVVGKVTLLLASAMLVFCLAVAVGGDPFLTLLYGEEYAGQQHSVTVLGLSLLVSSLRLGATKGLWVLDRPDVNFKAGLAGFVCTACVASLLIIPFQIVGVAYGLLAGAVVDTSVRCLWFRRLIAAVPENGEAVA